MGNRIVKIIYLVFMSLVVLALAAFMGIHISKGLTSSNDKLMLAFYVLLIIWGVVKVWTTIKALKRN